MSTSTDYWQARLNKAKELLEAAEDAQLQIMAGTMESYKIDTGQSQQTVTKLNITVFDKMIDALMNRIATLETRISGCGVHTGGPGW